jgi:hypothetical protein
LSAYGIEAWAGLVEGRRRQRTAAGICATPLRAVEADHAQLRMRTEKSREVVDGNARGNDRRVETARPLGRGADVPHGDAVGHEAPHALVIVELRTRLK